MLGSRRMTPASSLDASVNTVVAAEKSGIGRGCKLGHKSAVTNCKPATQDYEDATEVPDSFVIKDPTKLPTRGWGDDDPAHTPLDDLKLPMIDMLPLMTTDADQHRPVDKEAAEKVVTEIGRACEDWGFFQAVNHGIPESVIDRLVEAAHEFFRLPMEEKEAYAGSGAPGQTEGYYKGDFGWNDCMVHSIQPKLAPENDFMPDMPSNYRLLMEEFTNALRILHQVLWTSLSQYLGLEFTTLQKAQEDGSGMRMRINYYPKCPEPEKVLGLVGHKDFGSMTVLLQDEMGGLQVQKSGTDVWVDVKPKKGAVAFNIGNQVEMLSNGRYISAMHRALVNGVKPRLSIAAFANPGLKCIISPLQELLDKTGQPPRYKPVVFGDYIPKIIADHKAGLRGEARYEINRD